LIHSTDSATFTLSLIIKQSSLEAIYSAPSWQKDVFLHDWSAFHSYDSAPYRMRSFSMHFPGRLKVYRVAKTWVYLHTLGTHASVDDSEEAELTEYAAGLLRDYLAKYSEPATRLGFKPHPEEKGEVEQVSCKQTCVSLVLSLLSLLSLATYPTTVPAHRCRRWLHRRPVRL